MPAPVGNQYAVKAKRWSAAIDNALAKRSRAEGIEALDDLAEQLLKACDEGDISALRELGDRLEGKPAQAIALSGEVNIGRAETLSDDDLASLVNAGNATPP